MDSATAAMTRPEPPERATSPGVPAAISRPPLRAWLAERDIDLRSAGRALGRSHEWVRTLCLPFDHPRRVVPDAEASAAIYAWTGGAISPASFHAPGATGGPDASPGPGE